ncbi:putative zinc finger protein, partial [Orchesella cincta]
MFFFFRTLITATMESNTGKRRYKCELCDKLFASVESRSHHVQTHNGEKSYKCNVCGKTLTSKQN